MVKGAARQSLSFAAGLLFSRGIVFSQCAPFGVAAVAAVPQDTMFLGMLGALFGYLLPGEGWIPARYMVAVLAAVAIRWTLSDLMRFRNHPVFAPLVSLLPVLTTGLAVTGVSGSSAKTVLLTAAEAIFAGGSAFFMARTSLLLDPESPAGWERKKDGAWVSQDAACVILTVGIALLCLSGSRVGEFSPAHVLAIVGVLLAAAYGGPAGGSIAGIATGVCFSLATSGVSYLSAGYALGGLTAGLFSPGGRLACAAAFVIAHGTAALQAGSVSLALTGMYEVTAATVLFLLIPEKAGQAAMGLLQPREKPSYAYSLGKAAVGRLDHAAKALEDVSRCVTEVSGKLAKVDASDISSVYDRIGEKTCRTCGIRQFCWEKEKESTMEALGELTPFLRRSGKVLPENFPAFFAARCARLEDVCRAVNENYDAFSLQEASDRRASQIRDLVADQFVTVSSILEQIAGDLEMQERLDLQAADRTEAVLRKAGIQPLETVCRVDALGRMTVEGKVSRLEKINISKAELTRQVSAACRRSFGLPIFQSVGEICWISFKERPRFRLKTGSAQHSFENGTFCGDSLEFFFDGKGCQYALISDGMGTGGRAAVDGAMASGIASRLLQAGISPDAALRIVNSALMVKSGEESLATLDLCAVDLFTGKIEISKAGAPVSFFRKEGRAFSLEAPSLPAGILRQVRFAKLTQQMEGEDLVVLVSDGALAGGSQWILEELEKWQGDSPQTLADRLLTLAVENRKDGRDDDITVAVLELEACRK